MQNQPIAIILVADRAAPSRIEVAAALTDLIVLGGALKTIESAAQREDDNHNPQVAALAAAGHALAFDAHASALDHFKGGDSTGLVDAARFAEQGIESASYLIAAIGVVAPSFVRDVLPSA
ncbi:hypothetical protein [Paraburkholderia sp. A1RO-5L]|uniref:hypothetical protein n=1 Tax=Paraburkholderia sp. A1RO-5L TaxID=3028370 RepID=UPI003B8239FE